ncbi:aldehyde dehydrogenase family protein [Rhizobium laguerreae]|uniref:aldehyde dehydrogenase family protein n=1 Tax=Rhizobium laguerreae TaxID=1076926 RepID=UPI001C910B08|nr:aldehyde dehydrogenase family protein [Rhizobium laguerreae]MBY3348021.1 aldehyde dehydrogenase family protein [Rhizobium laguerreae]MBY3354984.1 aldehyde dehydrogenase family protein [Rhizobium laguerreae]MBY3376289.1 aldehyde dehydrogenase family protein [Rhizobium laguerreae]MBY3431288.1 aldehyde dehydrogenase family protein [Rhizobium laguerreae]MBY3439903.1 aldehyde dehydrogenase family protein [Rhizobium laguerreae]
MIEVVQAFDRAHIASLPTDDASALETKLSTAQARFRDRAAWLQPYERIRVLRNLAGLVEKQREAFATLIAREGGKPYSDALVETDRAIDGIHNAADLLRARGGAEIPMGLSPASENRRAWTIKEPIGVVAAISAFNHPLNLIVHQVAPAIATGCPVIVKPAAATPLCCLELVKLVHEAGMPDGWVQTLLPESRALAEAFASDARIAFLSFIGSAKVGWRLRSILAAGTRCSLEHGGVAPVIIDRSADLDAIIEPIAKGGYYHAGQVCVSVQRIYVHSQLKNAFVERFAALVAQLRVGDPTLAETEVGPLINPAEAERVETWIAEAVASGARRIGDGRLSETTLTPAILVDPPAGAKVSAHEIFGPVTCVYGYDNIDEAIARANSLEVAFQASIFTRELETAFHAAERLDASAVMVNDNSAFRTDWMPFAGRRASGYGIGGIPYTAHEMTAEKMIVFKR